MKIPGSDAAKNLYNAFNLGFNPKSYFDRSPSKIAASSLHVLSPTGLLTAGGLAVGGAAIGAAAGSMMEGDMIGKGTAVGAAAGALALPAVGLTVRARLEIGKRAIPALGSAVLKAPGALLKGGIGFAKGIQEGVNIPGIGAIKPVAGMAGKAFAGFASMMVDWDNTKVGKEFLDSVKLTGPISGARLGAEAGWEAGKTLPGKIIKGGIHGATGALINGETILWGSSIIAGAAGAFNEMNRAHMGQMDRNITRPTPRIPAYDLNAGATGDLVFALNANRRG
jgi:hypothetical protein